MSLSVSRVFREFYVGEKGYDKERVYADKERGAWRSPGNGEERLLRLWAESKPRSHGEEEVRKPGRHELACRPIWL